MDVRISRPEAVSAGRKPHPVMALCGVRNLLGLWLLKRRRFRQTYDTFACFFAGQGVPEPLIQAVYRSLSRRNAPLASFPVDPLDSLREVYGLDCYHEDELTDFMNLVRASGQLDFCRPVPVFLPCETVADLVFLLAARCEAIYASAPQSYPPIAAERGSEQKAVTRWA